MTTEQLERTMNIGLDKARKILRVTTECDIHALFYPISRRDRIDHLYLCQKYMSGIWYMDWMPAATQSITQCKGAFVYFTGEIPEVYPKASNMSKKSTEMLQEF